MYLELKRLTNNFSFSSLFEINGKLNKLLTQKMQKGWMRTNEVIFRCIIPAVFYLQLKVGSFESKHNYLMSSLFKLITCFGLCTGPSSGHEMYN